MDWKFRMKLTWAVLLILVELGWSFGIMTGPLMYLAGALLRETRWQGFSPGSLLSFNRLDWACSLGDGSDPESVGWSVQGLLSPGIRITHGHFHHILLSKVSHKGQLWFNKWRNTFYLLMGRVAKSQGKAVSVWIGEQLRSHLSNNISHWVKWHLLLPIDKSQV